MSPDRRLLTEIPRPFSEEVALLPDEAGVSRIYLCGDSETPPNIKIQRAAVGTDKWVSWEYWPTAAEAISALRKHEPKVKCYAIEQDKKSVDYRKVKFSEPLAFVVGHETTGVSRETLDACEGILEIPMYGVNVSLNVMVSLAIVLFRAVE